MAKLAARVLASGGKCTTAEAAALAGCVLGQFEKAVKEPAKRG